MIGVSPRQLEIFVAVAVAGSVRGAAGQLHLSQPAVSMGLSELERLLGRRVFDRVQRRLHLNAHGKRLLPQAQEILERLREFGAAESPGQLSGDLRLGASNTIGNYLVGDLLGDFVATHPRVSLRLHAANATEQHLNLMTPAGARLSLYLASPDDADAAATDPSPLLRLRPARPSPGHAQAPAPGGLRRCAMDPARGGFCHPRTGRAHARLASGG